MAFLVLLAAAARTRVIASGLGGCRVWPRTGWFCVMLVTVLDREFGLKYRREAVQPEALVQSEHHQFGFRRIQFRDAVDLTQHALDPSARGFARHRQRIGKQRVIT